MNQTRLESGLETFLNYLSGFILAYLTYEFIVIPVPWLLGDAFLVTCLFTAISVVRTYYWRRFFNAGVHKMVHNLVKNMRW